MPRTPAKPLPCSSWLHGAPLVHGAGGSAPPPPSPPSPPRVLSPARPFSSSQTPQSFAPVPLWQRLPFAQKYRSGQGASVAKTLLRLQRAGKRPNCPRWHLLARLRLRWHLCFPPSKPRHRDGGKKSPRVALLAARAPLGNALAAPRGEKTPSKEWFCGMKSGCEVVAGMQGAAGHVASRGQHPVHVPIPVTP